MAVTNGRIWRKDGAWHIEAAPHVAMRAKRVFGQIGSQQMKVLKLKDTPDVCRDIAWFCERYPMAISPEDEHYLEECVAAHRERESLVAKLLAGVSQPRRFELALPPRDYQRVAAELLLQTGALLLGDDVGLGKTVSAITAISDPRARPALVVTLTHLPRQWKAELKRFAPGLRVHVLKKGTPYDLTAKPRRGLDTPNQDMLPGMRPDVAGVPDVIITNYHKLAGWAETLAPVIRSVFFDEAQELRSGPGTPRNPGPAKYMAAAHLAEAASFRCGMTATPIYNYGSEIWSILNVLAPHAVGTREEFVREWCSGPDGKERISEPEAFGTYLRSEGIMLRRTRAEVGRELPPITKIPYDIEADTEAIDKIGEAAASLAKIILAQGGGFEKLKASEELSNLLRQATGIAKATYVAEFVKVLLESGESRVLLSGHHHAVYDIWRDRLQDVGIVFYTGDESEPQKAEAKRKFLAGEARVMAIANRAGAGLDGLQTVCRTVVVGELDWSPGVHEQLEGRIYRDGQTDPVMVYYPIADSGSDPIVSDVLGIKKAQLEGLRDPNGAAAAPLVGSDKDLKRLAEYVLRKRVEAPQAASAAEAVGHG